MNELGKVSILEFLVISDSQKVKLVSELGRTNICEKISFTARSQAFDCNNLACKNGLAPHKETLIGLVCERTTIILVIQPYSFSGRSCWIISTTGLTVALSG